MISPDIPDGLHAVEEYSVEDLQEAHEVLDALDEARWLSEKS